MEFSMRVPADPFWFNTVYLSSSTDDPYYLITQHRLEEGQRIFIENYPPALKLNTFFSVGQIGLGGYISKGAPQGGYVLHSKYPSKSLASGVLAYMSSNLPQDPPRVDSNPVEARLVLRTPLFFMYHSINRATLASNAKPATRIHDSLTSV